MKLIKLSRIALAVASLAAAATPSLAQNASTVRLVPAPLATLPGSVDSNSPALWSSGASALVVFTSAEGWPQRSDGPSLLALGTPSPVTIDPQPAGGTWMEAVVRDSRGVIYGFYHNESEQDGCGDNLFQPRIGAARSLDDGVNWQDLGTIWESSDGRQCNTTNPYVTGGVGDFSVMLDADQQFLYLFYSAYGGPVSGQGVAVARMAWGDRDAPTGALASWRDGAWVRPNIVQVSESEFVWFYPTGTPIFPARLSWHSDDGRADAFWGPSIHWNTHLGRYVMLLSHADTVGYSQEGIYITSAPSLEDPLAWSTPERILAGGSWYPQVMGLEPGVGNDKVAGRSARFYMAGTSDALIEFERDAGDDGSAPAPPSNVRFVR